MDLLGKVARDFWQLPYFETAQCPFIDIRNEREFGLFLSSWPSEIHCSGAPVSIKYTKINKDGAILTFLHEFEKELRYWRPDIDSDSDVKHTSGSFFIKPPFYAISQAVEIEKITYKPAPLGVPTLDATAPEFISATWEEREKKAKVILDPQRPWLFVIDDPYDDYPAFICPPLFAGQVAMATCLDIGYFDLDHIKSDCELAIRQMKGVGIIHHVDYYEEVTPKQALQISNFLRGHLDN